MRNPEKDAKEMAERKEKMMRVGFSLFSERTIESVSMQEVAKACSLGIATIYRYFPTKLEFVIAVGTAQWKQFHDKLLVKMAENGVYGMSARDQYEASLDCFIEMYRSEKDLLRFNYDFNRYIQVSKPTAEQMREHMEIVLGFAQGFGNIYDKALVDHTLRTDVPREVLVTASMHIMLAVASRYAAGLIYHRGEDDCSELTLMKNMLLKEYAL